MAYTDMAVEFIKNTASKDIGENIKRTDITVNEETSLKLRRPKGSYITVESPLILKGRRDLYPRLIEEIASALKTLMKGCSSIFAAGIGNSLLTADALGARTVSKLKITRSGETYATVKELSAFSPSVSGLTGIDSFDVVSGIADKIKPDCVLVIDSLASATVGRVGTAFQLCDAGLVPGSGVENHQKALNAKNLKVKKVVSIGVPLVVYGETIIADALKVDVSDLNLDEEIKNLLVTPKDIDFLMEECAYVISSAINAAIGL